jgi:hypothetical protein
MDSGSTPIDAVVAEGTATGSVNQRFLASATTPSRSWNWNRRLARKRPRPQCPSRAAQAPKNVPQTARCRNRRVFGTRALPFRLRGCSELDNMFVGDASDARLATPVKGLRFREWHLGPAVCHVGMATKFDRRSSVRDLHAIDMMPVFNGWWLLLTGHQSDFTAFRRKTQTKPWVW